MQTFHEDLHDGLHAFHNLLHIYNIKLKRLVYTMVHIILYTPSIVSYKSQSKQTTWRKWARIVVLCMICLTLLHKDGYSTSGTRGTPFNFFYYSCYFSKDYYVDNAVFTI
jgi:hypothetical protein